MAQVRVELNHAGIRQMLQSPEVEAELLRRAKLIAAAAGPGFEPDSEVGRSRARASVITATFEARLDEARNHTLERAMDAGRG